MSVLDNKRKKAYDETASLITNLHFKDSLNLQEMTVLLSILDLAVLNEGQDPLIHLLKIWRQGNYDDELNEIIKATLLGIDFSDKSSIDMNMEIIRDLLNFQPDNWQA